MDTITEPSIIALRLRELQADRGVTLQDMADRSNIPKRSLENYMKLKAAQRPGVDALLAISDGFDVSLDWLVGRETPAPVHQLTKKQYAIAAYAATMILLHRLRSEQEKSNKSIFADSKIIGRDVPDLAMLAMLDFLESVDTLDV